MLRKVANRARWYLTWHAHRHNEDILERLDSCIARLDSCIARLDDLGYRVDTHQSAINDINQELESIQLTTDLLNRSIHQIVGQLPRGGQEYK